MTLKDIKIAFTSSAVTCLLFSSGLLVVLTPFPLLFTSAIYGKAARRNTIILTVLLAALFYILLLPWLTAMIDKWPYAQLILMLPGAGLAQVFNIVSAQYFGFAYLAYFVIFGYIFSEGFFRKWPIKKQFALSVGISFAVFFVALILPYLAGFSVVGGAEKYLHQLLTELVAAQESSGVSSDKIALLGQNMDAIIKTSIYITPSVMLVMGLLMACANRLLAMRMIRLPKFLSTLGDAGTFKLPEYLVWVAILTGFSIFAEIYFIHAEVLRIIALNAAVIICALYFLQGMVILSFFLRNMRARFMRTIIYVTVFFFLQVSVPLIALIGLTDIWVDYRKFASKVTKDNTNILP